VAFSLHVPRPLRAALALVVLLALAGATYQGVLTSLERRRYPHPGRLIDVGGHQLQIHCTGAGTPTVVLEAPAAGLSVSWIRVQETLAPLTRVCSYDRAGLGWSEQGDAPFEPSGVPGELRVLLGGAQEQAPYVVAGAGLGAAFAEAFAARFPEVTAAVVLLDVPTPEEPSRDRSALGGMPDAMPWLARVGLLRVMKAAGWSTADPASRAFMNRPDHLTRAALELGKWDDAVRLAASEAARAPSRVPRIAAMLPAPLTSEEGAMAAAVEIRRAVATARGKR
jgi:pimeloyl-ACP methyl ester carboxylesterase